MTAAIYHHTATPAAELRAIAARREWTIECEYMDPAGDRQRPQLDRLLTDASRQLFGVVLVCSIAAFISGDHVPAAFRYVHQLTQWNVEFFSLTEPHFCTTRAEAGREWIMATAAWFTEYDRAARRLRIKAGIAATKKAGNRVGRPSTTVDAAQLARLHRGDGNRRPQSYTELERRTGIARSTIARKIQEWEALQST